MKSIFSSQSGTQERVTWDTNRVFGLWAMPSSIYSSVSATSAGLWFFRILGTSHPDGHIRDLLRWMRDLNIPRREEYEV